MPINKFLEIYHNEYLLEITDSQASDVAISYTLEDPENFEQKGSSSSFAIQVPCSVNNDMAFNTFHNPNVIDMSTGSVYDDMVPCQIKANGVTMFIGNSCIVSATHTNKPENYTLDAWGGNAHWLLQMQNITLWDCMNTATHTFDVTTVQNSWSNFDTDEYNDYVYAPVRYRQPFGNNGGSLTATLVADSAVTIYDLKPSLSIFWIIYRGFRLMGYELTSTFMTSRYFRRMVMPWTWGDFFDVKSTLLTVLQFKATGFPPIYPPSTFHGSSLSDPTWFNSGPDQTMLSAASDTSHIDFVVASFPFSSMSGTGGHYNIGDVSVPYGYDNSNSYSFDEVSGIATWTMNVPSDLQARVGTIKASFQFSLIARVSSSSGSTCKLILEYSLNGGSWTPCDFNSSSGILLQNTGAGSSGDQFTPQVANFLSPNIVNGDVLRFRLVASMDPFCAVHIWESIYVNSTFGMAFDTWNLNQSKFELTGFYIGLGSTVNMQYYDKFRSYTFLDLLRGLIDTFNLSVQTDNFSNKIYIEPTYSYDLPNETSTPDHRDGYFQESTFLDYNNKIDLTKESELQLYSDVERQFDFMMKSDSADGGLNIYAGRYKGLYINNGSLNYSGQGISNNRASAVAGMSRYLFPSRFQQGTKTYNNRFFAPCMHYKATQWQSITGSAPQLICIIPENVSNSSAADISQSFEPKIAYYKGLTNVDTDGKFFWAADPATLDGDPLSHYIPLMFSVNYGVGGENDPVVTYCDQNINGNFVNGLMRTFFLKRLSTMRAGRLYKPWMLLNNNDIANQLHREGIIIKGGIYYLIGIDKYFPMRDDSCKVTLWKYNPPTSVDDANCFPSNNSIITNPAILDMYDLKYAPLLIFQTDLPQL